MRRLFAPLLLILLTACRSGPDTGAPAGPAAGAQDAWPPVAYADLAAEHAVYRLDPAASSLDFVVRREGPLARFGHDHVLAPRGLEGWFLAAEPLAGSRADLRFPTADLVIDDAASRRDYRLDTTPDTEAIEATRTNLLTEVLRRGAWPVISVALDGLPADDGELPARLTVTWGGERYTIERPLELSRDASLIRLAGRFTVRQTELGMTPLAILGGGLRVRDEIEVYLDLQGRRLE